MKLPQGRMLGGRGTASDGRRDARTETSAICCTYPGATRYTSARLRSFSVWRAAPWLPLQLALALAVRPTSPVFESPCKCGSHPGSEDRLRQGTMLQMCKQRGTKQTSRSSREASEGAKSDEQRRPAQSGHNFTAKILFKVRKYVRSLNAELFYKYLRNFDSSGKGAASGRIVTSTLVGHGCQAFRVWG